MNDGAKIILGPVYAAAANAAGTAVAARGVNVLSFSNNTDIAGGNVFVLGHTFENTASRLVGYATSQGKRNFTIAFGRDTAERKGRDAIVASLARAGLTPAGETSYELSQNGVVQAVEEVTATAKSANADAIFMTSGTAGALPILSQLIIENGVDRETTQLIGLQRWDIPPGARELPGLQGGWFALPSPALTAPRRFFFFCQPPPGIKLLSMLAKSPISATRNQRCVTAPTGSCSFLKPARLGPASSVILNS